MSYVIAIDGPAGAGKSSVSRKLAEILKIKYLDTGAIYRAIALILKEAEVKPEENDILIEALGKIRIELNDKQVLVNDFDVSSEIRTPEVDNLASVYSALPSIRKALLNFQREQKNFGSLIAEGRDIGTVVFPDAEFKFFLTASPEARAERRYKQRISKNEEADYSKILNDIKARDEHDLNRKIAPLRVPENAIFLDTSDLSEDQVINIILEKINSKKLK